MRNLKNILVTGGCGFIGSNFIHYILKNPDFSGSIVNADKLTYSGNLENLREIEKEFGNRRYFFEKIDICDSEKINIIFKKYNIDTVVHFAAESHVDRSIHGPATFIRTNIFGTFNLLEIAREYWKEKDGCLFHHVSTDEVYGSLGNEGHFFEHSKYDPRSPYSASKASSDHLVSAYYHTYNLPITISNCSNNYGPFQFPEKLIPFMITNMLENAPLPIYGDGKNIRDWLHVEDHNRAIWRIINKGVIGDIYNIGGDNEVDNLTLVNSLCELVASNVGKTKNYYKNLIKFVHDRPGHDRRYAVNCEKIKNDLDWNSKINFITGLQRTVKWYLDNKSWVNNIKNGEYLKWVNKNYDNRQSV